MDGQGRATVTAVVLNRQNFIYIPIIQSIPQSNE
jgi:hypothetical protein